MLEAGNVKEHSGRNCLYTNKQVHIKILSTRTCIFDGAVTIALNMTVFAL